MECISCAGTHPNANSYGAKTPNAESTVTDV